MSKTKKNSIKKKEKAFFPLTNKNGLVSKTINIYTNALSSGLCTSPTGPSPSVNLPSRVLNFEGFSWHKGFRNPLASISYKKAYETFLEALHLIIRIRGKGGKIYVLFDSNQLRPSYSILGPEKPLKNQTKTQYKNITWSGEKWVGGTFSNFKQISKSINLYKTLSRQFLGILKNQKSARYFVMAKKFHGNLPSSNCSFSYKKNEDAKHTGFENLPLVSNVFLARISRKKTQTNPFLEKEPLLQKNNVKYKNLPDLVIVENAEKYRNVIAEAETLKIPVIAFLESDAVSNISIGLPLNALKHYFLAFLLYVTSKMPTK